MQFRVSNHAVEKYRERALGCPERSRGDDLLRQVIIEHVLLAPMRRSGGCLVVECGPLVPKSKKPHEMRLADVNYTFVIDEAVVVTVLGYRMRASKKAWKKRRIRRQRELRARMQATVTHR